MTERWRAVKLGSVLQQVEEVITLQDDVYYQQVTVALHGKGVRLRRKVLGSEVRTKRQYVVRSGQLVYSRIDARNGAFGLVPRELDGAVVSGDFPVFNIVGDVDPRFLIRVIQSRTFVARCAEPSRGVTNRQRLSEDVLLALPVMLPSRRLQAARADVIEKVGRLALEARALRNAIREEREDMLRAFAAEISHGARRKPLGEVAPIVRRPVQVESALDYLELGVRSFGRGTFHKPGLKGTELGDKRLFHIEPGDLIFSNVFAWEGAIAIATEADHGRVGSHRFITCVPDPHVVTAEFLRAWFLGHEGMACIHAASPGAAGRNRTLGLKKLVAIDVPVPRLSEQRRLQSMASSLQNALRLEADMDEELDELVPAAVEQQMFPPIS